MWPRPTTNTRVDTETYENSNVRFTALSFNIPRCTLVSYVMENKKLPSGHANRGHARRSIVSYTLSVKLGEYRRQNNVWYIYCGRADRTCFRVNNTWRDPRFNRSSHIKGGFWNVKFKAIRRSRWN